MTEQKPAMSRPGIRWSRGFFRFWLVLSVMWVAAIFFIADTPKELSRAYRMHVAMKADAADQGGASEEDNSKSWQDAPIVGSSQDRLLEEALEVAQARVWADATKNLRQNAALGFIPPLVVLVIGTMIAWALRGFRK